MAAAEEDVVVFFDADAVPTNSNIVMATVDYVRNTGGFVGIAQTSNHLDPWHIYAGPAFFVIYRDAWLRMQRPSFCETSNCDVAQNISRVAPHFGVQHRCLYPTHWERKSAQSLWGLGNYGKFATGTHYRGGIYHLFQSWNTANAELFALRCSEIVAGTFSTNDMQLAFDDTF